MNKTLFLAVTLFCALAAFGQNQAPVDPPEAPPAEVAKPEKQPPAIASDSIVRLMQLRQDAAQVAQEIVDFQAQAATLQRRGQTLQARLNVAEREALEKAGLDPDKYALDESFKPVKRQAQPQAQRGAGPAKTSPAAKPKP